MKSTKVYLKMFGLDVLETAKKFDRDLFIKTFGEEFDERVMVTVQACKKMDVQFTYNKFLNLVSEQHTKFNAISNKKLGGVLNEDLFKAFYAMYVVKHREKLFPIEHQQLAEKAEQHKLYIAQKLKKETEAEERKQLIAKNESKKKANELVSQMSGALQKKGVRIIVEDKESKPKHKEVKKPVKKSKGL